MEQQSRVIKINGSVSEYSSVSVRGSGRVEEVKVNLTADAAVRIELENYPAELSLDARESLSAAFNAELSKLNAVIKKMLTQKLDITLLRSVKEPRPPLFRDQPEAPEAPGEQAEPKAEPTAEVESSESVEL